MRTGAWPVHQTDDGCAAEISFPAADLSTMRHGEFHITQQRS